MLKNTGNHSPQVWPTKYNNHPLTKKGQHPLLVPGLFNINGKATDISCMWGFQSSKTEVGVGEPLGTDNQYYDLIPPSYCQKKSSCKRSKLFNF
jgi:hypothetical protein